MSILSKNQYQIYAFVCQIYYVTPQDVLNGGI